MTGPMALVGCGRFGEPEDLAYAAARLARDASDYVVGTTHFIDGGMPFYPGLAGNGCAGSGDGRAPERCSAGLSGLAKL